jgi:hypothetical protein
MKKILTRDEILAVEDLPTEEVFVPEWKGSVVVRTLTGRERDELEASMFQDDAAQANMENVRARLVSLTAVDRDGKRLFTFADAKALGEKSSRALDRVFGVAQRLSGLRREDIKELAKNSPGGRRAASPSG